jgi:single-strand DNA-binding protein
MAKKDLNRFELIGNLGRDPEMRYVPSGKPVTSFSVAVNNQYTGANGETVKETLWVKAVTWGKQAEAANQYLKKGSKVYLAGRVQPIKIWNGQDGAPHADLELNVSEMQFLGGGNGETASGGHEEPEFTTGAPEEDIPF